MRPAHKAKGPAEVAASPSHVPTNSRKGMTNMQTNTTAPAGAPDFPIPFVMQEPGNDLLDALALLAMIDRCLDDGTAHGLTRETVRDMTVAFSMARENIELVAAFLNTDDREGTLDIYRRVRRDRIVSSYERGLA